MGWRPRDVYECTCAEFEAAWNGWLKVHAATEETGEVASYDDLEDLSLWYAEKYGRGIWQTAETSGE